MTSDEVIKLFHLVPLPEEGGYYRETYRSEQSLSTAIYYLITPESFSALHRLLKDELFHFYLGDPVEMLQIAPQGEGRILILGTDIQNGQRPQVLVPAGHWQGMRLGPRGKWALLGVTVAPAFEFSDFETGEREMLLKKFPSLSDLILKYTLSSFER
jgi:predicted cupin superfamily sugar epimerase